MPPLHAFVDESASGDYILAAATIPSRDLAAARRAMRRLLMPKQRRLHFTNERPVRKRLIIDTMLDLGIHAVVVSSPMARDEVITRQRCLTRLAAALAAGDVRDIVSNSTSRC